ncbi:MAG TPA: ABC transporter substrate-binding protein [Candidatus Binatia bacterium]|nr:ABC transporter substrate-binding protein [Candidatus Binatia bacterium]
MDQRSRRTRPSTAACLILASQLFCSFQLCAAEAPQLRGVYNALGGTMTPAWIAQELGLFTKHGLQHSLTYLAATTAIQAIVGGTEEIGLVGNQGIDVALEGSDTVYIANTASRFIFHLYGDPAIKSVADLKGKVLAATQPAASTDYAGRLLLRKYGLVPDKDVKILYAGSAPALLSTLKSGNAAAGLMSAPITFQAQELGLKHILNLTELNIPFVFVSVVTTRKVIQQKPDAVIRYLRAYTEAISIIRRDKETTLKVMGKFMKTDNRKVLEAVYEEHLPVFQRVPLMTKEAVQAVLDVAKNPRAQQMKPEDFYDNSFIQKLEVSGFINSLYAR